MTHHRILLFVILAACYLPSSADAQLPQAKFTNGQQIALWPNGAPDSLDRLTDWLHDNQFVK